MKIISVLLLLIATIFIYSCGDDEVKGMSEKEYSIKIQNLDCEIQKKCEKIDNLQECKDAIKTEDGPAFCDGVDGKFSLEKANDCISCLEGATCDENFNDKKCDEKCDYHNICSVK